MVQIITSWRVFNLLDQFDLAMTYNKWSIFTVLQYNVIRMNHVSCDLLKEPQNLQVLFVHISTEENKNLTFSGLFVAAFGNKSDHISHLACQEMPCLQFQGTWSFMIMQLSPLAEYTGCAVRNLAQVDFCIFFCIFSCDWLLECTRSRWLF